MQFDDVPNSRRRRLLEAAAWSGGVSILGADPFRSAFAQEPPDSCPTPPSGGTAFQAGQDTRPVIDRPEISTLNASQLSELRAAFAALRALQVSNPTDPRGWLLQADLHALYCNACTIDHTQIHGTWNFFPWHRAYLYFYERILGSLVNNLNGFRLPYWSWEHERSLPDAYRSPAASTNSLWDTRRNAAMASGSALANPEGTLQEINSLYAVDEFGWVGGSPSSGGLCESVPHNLIHSDLGTKTFMSFDQHRDMGNLGFAAQDPIFFAHHGNIDKIWSRWTAMGTSTSVPAGTYRNPSDPIFLNASWSFYDENANVVSIRAEDVLDHTSNLRYTYVPMQIRIPPYEIIRCRLLCCGPDPAREPFLEIPPDARQQLLSAARAQRKTLLLLREVEIPEGIFGNFDVLAVRGRHRESIGSFGIVGESSKAMKMSYRLNILLDATRSLADIVSAENPAMLQVRGRRGARAFMLQAKEAELRVER